MELFFKNTDGQLEEVSFKTLLIEHLANGNFQMDNGDFDGENHQWVGIVQESTKPSQVVVNISFNAKGDKITEVKVFETPIKRVVDEDSSRQIV